MYWLGPTRYLRWVAASLLLVIGLYAEFRPTATTEHPFASDDIQRGAAITAIEWRGVPAGLLHPLAVDGAVAGVDIRRGDPIVASALAAPTAIPAGWWSIPVAIPFLAPRGTQVQLVDERTGAITDGVIVAEPPDDPLAIDASALIAVPPETAAAFAVSAADGAVTVLIAGG